MVGVLMMLAVLMLCALLVSKDILKEGNKAIIPTAALLAGFAAEKLVSGSGGEEALTGVLFSAGVVFLLLVLLSLAVKNTQYQISSIMLNAGVYASGAMLGKMARVNKKYKQKHRRQQRYNK